MSNFLASLNCLNDVTMAWDNSGLGQVGTIATAPAFRSACQTIGGGAAEDDGNEFSAVDEDVKRCLEERAQMDIRVIQSSKVDVVLEFLRCDHERDIREIKGEVDEAFEDIGAFTPFFLRWNTKLFCRSRER
jgi:hypothetical protein